MDFSEIGLSATLIILGGIVGYVFNGRFTQKDRRYTITNDIFNVYAVIEQEFFSNLDNIFHRDFCNMNSWFFANDGDEEVSKKWKERFEKYNLKLLETGKTNFNIRKLNGMLQVYSKNKDVIAIIMNNVSSCVDILQKWQNQGNLNVESWIKQIEKKEINFLTFGQQHRAIKVKLKAELNENLNLNYERFRDLKLRY